MNYLLLFKDIGFVKTLFSVFGTLVKVYEGKFFPTNAEIQDNAGDLFHKILKHNKEENCINTSRQSGAV